jgi:soluble lytic murein transglycosylase-like protein
VIGVVTLVVLGIVGGVTLPAAAQVFRFVAPDGTVHFTNAPTDPRYQREGLAMAAPSPWFGSAQADASPYVREIGQAAARYGVPEGLIRAVIRVESGYNPRAVSHKGARGLMQLMPKTAAQLGVRNLFDPRENIDAGARHLRALAKRFRDLPLVLAAYNAGEHAVLAWRGIPPFPETRQYVVRVLEHYDETLPDTTFRTFEQNGAVVYTNIPARLRLF